jgi:hypothetical protein
METEEISVESISKIRAKKTPIRKYQTEEDNPMEKEEGGISQTHLLTIVNGKDDLPSVSVFPPKPTILTIHKKMDVNDIMIIMETCQGVIQSNEDKVIVSIQSHESMYIPKSHILLKLNLHEIISDDEFHCVPKNKVALYEFIFDEVGKDIKFAQNIMDLKYLADSRGIRWMITYHPSITRLLRFYVTLSDMITIDRHRLLQLPSEC